LGKCMSGACRSVRHMVSFYILCLMQAHSYANVLIAAGWPAYESAQDTNCEWSTCCK
jgi:hypothetical protein